MEAQIVPVEDQLDTLGKVNVNAGVIDQDAGINEVRLPLNLAAAQRRQERVRLHQADGCAGERDADAIPERELAADEIRIIEDGVEPGSALVGRILVALREEERCTVAQEVAIHRSLDRRHLRTNRNGPTRNRVAVVVPEGEVVHVRQIDPAQVAIAV